MSKLLIIDDDVLSVRVISSIINWKDAGFDEVLTGYCYIDAVKIIDEIEIDILVCDIEMPGSNGLEVLKYVKQKQPFTETIFLTNFAEFSYAQQAVKLGGYDYLLKPVDYDVLKDITTKALKIVTDRKNIQKKTKNDIDSDIKAKSKIVVDAVYYIKDNYKLSLSRECVASHVFMNPQYLARIFKKEIGVSINEYIIKYKIEKAKQMLNINDIKVGEIAETLGFSQISHFNKIFKLYTHKTPSEYRKDKNK